MSEDPTEQKQDEIEKALDNIRWARDSSLDGEILKSNSHLHRAEELLKQHKESNL
jgi:hypothetical protein